MAAVQVRAVSLLLPLYSQFFFSENFLSPLTSGACLQLADTRAMGQPVFGLDVRREHTQQKGNVADLLLCLLKAVRLGFLADEFAEIKNRSRLR